MLVRAQQHDTLDLLCWRHLGATARVVEVALELNPGIADGGPFIPHGHLVTLPDPSAVPTNTTQTISLWD
ncbi:tail protein X [Glaciimonas immobilis]|uniref:Phage tail protein X n=1 Tax=Glaciimonas immobilis TaxID=728004 RepID=A0A840RPZ7_9BURK|nr:tail protein X [Glaciimonas immobilis]KAF3999232.1 phage tail protein [Glaciimonas immobilis]MBB5198691.1 phage tail protein X [Glaciimonas immobilis]